LLIEDDVDVRRLMEHSLIAGGYEVNVAGTVLAGREMLRSQPYDLVITDVRLPDRSGIELADIASEKRVPVLIITGYAFNLPRSDLYRFEFLLKPVRPSELLLAVERTLQPEKA
jgi:DNA-binding NtrC family response regulator